MAWGQGWVVFPILPSAGLLPSPESQGILGSLSLRQDMLMEQEKGTEVLESDLWGEGGRERERKRERQTPRAFQSIY
jgi:hypothetical protein